MTAVSPGIQAQDGRAFARTLRASLRGRVFDDLGTRALYTSDASNYRLLPQLVVEPADAEDLATVVHLCREAGRPITARGAGTSIAGNACGSGVLVRFGSMAHVGQVDAEAMTVSAGAGAVLDAVNRAAAAHGLVVGPDPSTHNRCTVGGMVGNNACGSHSVRWGTTADAVEALDVVLADGSAWRVAGGSLRTVGAAGGSGGAGRDAGGPANVIAADMAAFAGAHEAAIRQALPPWPRRVSGYALDWLLPERGPDVAKALVGTEGTCALVTSATLRLVRPPVARALLVLGFTDDVEAAEAVPDLLPLEPLTVEGFDRALLDGRDDRLEADLLPAGQAWLLIEAGGATTADASLAAERLAGALGRRRDDGAVRIVGDPALARQVWALREDGSGRATRLADGTPAWPGFEDAVVPPDRLADYLRRFHALMSGHGIAGSPYGHFGEGCVHVRLGFGLERPEGPASMLAFTSAAADLVVACGGSLSGEHGDGRARGALLERQFSPATLSLFRAFKGIWDPAGLLNPGVVVDPAPRDADLRPPLPGLIPLRPTFALDADAGDLRLAALRCVGVGKCVAEGGSALMCPSFRATGDERHSTRGRARLLQEMISGSLSPAGWHSDEVREALDLCLACKGCRSDCPVHVDMATYKAEFLDHHYAGRPRPRSHYSLGWLPSWLRLVHPIAPVANAVLRTPPLARAFAWLAGMEPDRPVPPLARRTLVEQTTRAGPHESRAKPATAAPPAMDERPKDSTRPTDGSTTARGGATKGGLILWPDTFTNYLSPEPGLAAIEVLERAGFKVRVPRRPVCCGLTWISTGQLRHARREMLLVLGRRELAGSDPIVVLEPSCAATLRTDLPELVPTETARAFARRVVTLGEVLDAADFAIPEAVERRVLVQPHCHQQAVLGSEADRRVLERCGLRITESISGCCGLAGNFGAEAGHGEISRQVAALELLPALDRAAPGTLVAADGFSCRTQIAALRPAAGARHLAVLVRDQLVTSGIPPDATAGG